MARIPDTASFRRLLLCSAAMLLAVTTPGLVHAQGVGPSTSVNAGLGSAVPQNTALGSGLVNLRDLVSAPSLASGGEQVTFSASLGAYFGYTDNLAMSSGSLSARKQGSFEEHISPMFSVAADAARLQGSLTYSPDLRLYNSQGSANRVGQNLAGSGSAQLIENVLFVNASAFAAQASRSQLSAYNSSSLSNSAAQSQVYGYSFNPYLLHRFGDAANFKASYLYSGSYFDNGGYGSSATRQSNLGSATQTESLLLASGPDFQTLSHALEASASQFLGNGSERGGYRNLATYTVTYPVTRTFALVGLAGGESVHYSGTSSNGVTTSKAYNFKGPVGEGGIKFTPSEDSRLTVLYGTMDGGDAVSADGLLRLGARLTLSLATSSGLSTNSQDLQGLASASTVGPDGTLSRGMGSAPMGYSMNSAGANNAVYRLTRSSATVIYALDRDAFSASVSRTQTQNVNNSTTQGINSVSVLGSLGWQHELSESLSGSLGGSYGTTHFGGTGPLAGNSPAVGATARLSDRLSETLSAEINYSYIRQRAYGLSSPGAAAVQSANEILAGVVQRF
jgi:hypothetical protein